MAMRTHRLAHEPSLAHSRRPLAHSPPQTQVGKNKDGLAKTLKKEARGCQRLVLWLDCDLEGENIAHEVMGVCLEANPRCVRLSLFVFVFVFICMCA